MRRRDLAPALFGMAVCARAQTSAVALGGCSLLLNVQTGRILACEGADTARRWVAAPGSVMKPLSLLALLEGGKLTPAEGYFCPRRLVLNGQSLDCSHPYLAAPVNVSRAIAYSCNCAVAHFAQRFRSGELAGYLLRAGLCSHTSLIRGWEATGHVDAAAAGPPSQLQALGESGVRITPLELSVAYRRLASRAGEPLVAPIIEGLEGAVAFGTAQPARLGRLRVAGKTGSVMTGNGAHAAWFVGFAPSHMPEVAVVVLVQGRSGGADAAPLAGSLLKNYFAGRA